VKALVLAALVTAAVPSRNAEACWDRLDETYLLGNARTLPAHPSLFLHLARDSATDLPVFTRLDGTPIPYRLSQANTPGILLLRIDLDIVAGAMEIRFPNSDVPSRFVLVDAIAKPRTRRVDVVQEARDGTPWKYPWIAVDTDAELLRVERSDGVNHTVWFRPGGDFTTSGHARITALYSDGTEELILDYRPPSPRNDKWPLAALALLLSLGLIARQLLPVEASDRAGICQ
jgi:hypothetical protein